MKINRFTEPLEWIFPHSRYGSRSWDSASFKFKTGVSELNLNNWFCIDEGGQNEIPSQIHLLINMEIAELLHKENLLQYNPDICDVHYWEITPGQANTYLTDKMNISALKHNQENFQNNRNIPKEVNKWYQF